LIVIEVGLRSYIYSKISMTSDYTDFVLGATIKYLIQVESVLVSGLDNCQRCFSENQYTFS